MIVPGIASVTFRRRSPRQVIDLALKAGLQGIEWGGDIHVPLGQIQVAKEVGQLSTQAGLNVSAYGSYYTVGKSKDFGLKFSEVLDTAEALNAPIIRVWAGNRSSANASESYRRKVLEECWEIAQLAQERMVCLAFEFHDNTLNDTYSSSIALLSKLDHPAIKTYWQPIHGAGAELNAAGIELILPWIVGVHIFHWWPRAEIRLPLIAGLDHWKRYLHCLAKAERSIPGNLEFVKEDSSEQFHEDASTLLALIANQRKQLDT